MKLLRCLLIVALTFAPLPNVSAAGWLPLAKAPSGGGGCSQATALIARMSGSQNTTAVTNFVCGGVTDGWWAKLDFLHVPATAVIADANLNLVSSSFSLSCTGSPTFTANQGYTGNTLNTWCDTQYNPTTNATNYALNSAAFGVCILNNGSAQPYVDFGASDASSTNQVTLTPNAGFGTAYAINDSGFNFQAIVSSPIGSWIVSRTGSTTVTVYRQGSSVITGSQVSSAVPNHTLFTDGVNQNGTGGSTGDTVAADFAASGFSATDATNFTSRLQTYMTAIGTGGC